MKKILITGANSYIGMSVERYLAQWPEKYDIDTVDMIGDDWRKKSFFGYDTVFHVAGIAHIKETKKNATLYYKVNRDLAVETAVKAKADGVKQFIFLSSMSVYGMEEGAINFNTLTIPTSNYGKSKLEAERELEHLNSDSFAVAILRPPMVYGDGCKGNYQFLIKLANVMPFFPNYRNKRSMISIERLSLHIKDLIDNGTGGLILPQDEKYVCTCEMVRQIAEENGKKLPLISILNPVVSIVKKYTTVGKKAFGNLYYEMVEEVEK